MEGESTPRPQSDDATCQCALNNLPSEALGEIFVHCLPDDPSNHIQPDIYVAPMLLCQVSSRWRDVALKTPGLWTHLYSKFHACAPQIPTPQLLRRGIRSSDMDFLRWWMGNVCSPPILRLELDMATRNPLTPSSTDIQVHNEADNGPFFEHILSTARGLHLEECFLTALREYLGGCILECPSLNSLAIHSSSWFKPVPNTSERLFHDGNTLRRIPVIPRDNLKRLMINISPFHVPNTLPDSEQIPWTRITHLSFQTFLLAINDWHFFIRRCVSLQVGEFLVDEDIKKTRENPFNPSVCIPACLPHLWKLMITSWGCRPQFNLLFNLQLPALQSLKLRISNLATQELEGLFRSFPNLKMLDLSFAYMSNTLDEADEPKACPTQVRVWDLLPLLRFLSLSGWMSLETWVRDLMSSSFFAFGDHSENFKELELGVLDSAQDDDKIRKIRDAVQSHPDMQKLSLKANVVVRSSPRRKFSF